MTARDYYNENDDGAADWLDWLIAERLIPPGWVDRRSIADVQPADLEGFRRHHFFAGIGGWPLALELAHAPADWRIWTGSCPCQPFSTAGRRMGSDDARHLWPHLFRLIDACRPARVVGEQVAGAAGYGWFDGVALDLGAAGYASRAVDIPAAAVDSPQIRQRLYWAAINGAGLARANEPFVRSVAPAGQQSLDERHLRPDGGRSPVAGSPGRASRGGEPLGRPEGGAAAAGDDAGEHTEGVALGDPSLIGRREGLDQPAVHRRRRAPAGADGSDGHEGAAQGRASRRRLEIGRLAGWGEGVAPWWLDAPGADGRVEFGAGNVGSWWGGSEWIVCHDGKARRVADALAPLLVTGFPGRVVAWRGVGNAIVPPLACEVIAALIETEGQD